jgi:hypothetical protein
LQRRLELCIEEEDDNYRHLLRFVARKWRICVSIVVLLRRCYNVVTFLYGGGYYIFFVVAYDVVF